MTVRPMQVPTDMPRRRFDFRGMGRQVFARRTRRLYLIVAAVLFVLVTWGVCTVYVRPTSSR